MRLYLLQKEQILPVAREELYSFFERPENLAEITPEELGFQVLTPSPIPMGAGTLIDYTIRPFGLPMHWRTLITRHEPPRLFVDEQLKGPYLFWHHTHRFEEHEHGTKMVDEVRYLLPFGPLGRIVHRLLVRKQLEKIFAHRQKVIAERFSA